MTESNIDSPLSPPFPSDNPALTKDSPLSYRGRFGRLSFLAWSLVIGLVFGTILGLFFAVSLSGLHHGADPTVNPFSALSGGTIAVAAILYIALIYFSIILNIRRLHDLNLSGWWTLFPLGVILAGGILSFISPLIFVLAGLASVIYWLYLFIAPGTNGLNRFGPQRVTPGWEVALGWAYIVLIILGVGLGVTGYSKFASYLAHTKSETSSFSQSTLSDGTTTTTTTEQTDTVYSGNTAADPATNTNTTTSTTSTSSAS